MPTATCAATWVLRAATRGACSAYRHLQPAQALSYRISYRDIHELPTCHAGCGSPPDAGFQRGD